MTSFAFQSVRNGAPLSARDLPKLPPRAVALIFERIKSAGIAVKDVDATNTAPIVADLMVDLVHLTLKRIEPSVTREQIMENEDFDAVKDCFAAIQERNASLFARSGGATPKVAPVA